MALLRFLSGSPRGLIVCWLGIVVASISSASFVSAVGSQRLRARSRLRQPDDNKGYQWLRDISNRQFQLSPGVADNEFFSEGYKYDYRLSTRNPVKTTAEPNVIYLDRDEDSNNDKTQRNKDVEEAYAEFLKLVAGSMTIHPSMKPSQTPSNLDSEMPSDSAFPSTLPSQSSIPSQEPSMTTSPSQEPSVSVAPSSDPTLSFQPTETDAPSSPPSTSVQPSRIPSKLPSFAPTEMPSSLPSLSLQPSNTPSSGPTSSVGPSAEPTDLPTVSPTGIPSSLPSSSAQPSNVPSSGPTSSVLPSVEPSKVPTNLPTAFPTGFPTFFPTEIPSRTPTDNPSSLPSEKPSISFQPSLPPTLASCQISPNQRQEEILELLANVSNANLLLDDSFPQGQATEWILNNDEMALCPDNPKIIQRWALAVMYYATIGDEWTLCFDGDLVCPETTDGSGNALVNFLSPQDECEWFGITCGPLIDGERCVERIIFEDNNLSGSIPTELALLTELRVLGMEQGSVKGRIPSELGLLQEMIFIDLDFNELTGEIPSELWQLTKLKTLDLNVNNLGGALDSRIGNLLELDFVQLQNNLFTGSIPSEIAGLSNLNTFNVHKNDFSGSIPLAMCNQRPNPLSSLIADCECKGKEGKENPAKVLCDCCSGCGCKKENNA